MNDSNKALELLLAPAVAALGYELWGCFLVRKGHTAVLRVYIEKPEGINVDDCARVSHQVSGVLDVEDPIEGEYTLEVSSPGLNRPLFTLAHYARFVGATVKCKTKIPLAGRRQFQGNIENVQDNTIQLRCDEALITLTIDNIERANVVPDFSPVKVK